jgi:hypothetical protein
MHEAYRPVSLILALWPTQEFQFPADANQLGNRLREQFGLFDEQRPSAPVPGAMQEEWPRVILLGQQRHWALELAPAKISLRWAINEPMPFGQILEKHWSALAPIHAWLAENLNFRVYRLGMVTQIFCNTRSSANEKISQYFLHPRALQGQAPYEVQLGILSRVSLSNESMVNRWLRVRPLRTIDPRRVDFAAQIEVDVNTLPEDTQIKTARDLNAFYEAVGHHLENDIPLLNTSDFVE